MRKYDSAIAATQDAPAKTGHGVAAEADYRKFLRAFLPKKYGVAKGYVITPRIIENLYDLEEWDIIIYDALECPVLSILENSEDSRTSRKFAIPIEYVRAVVEVKATFNPKSNEKAVTKLLKLNKFEIETESERQRDGTFSKDVFCSTVFFETKVKSGGEYAKALGKFQSLCQTSTKLQFFQSLIIRGQTHPSCSGIFGFFPSSLPDSKIFVGRGYEYSEPFELEPPCDPYFPYGRIASLGFNGNSFWNYMINFVRRLNYRKDDPAPVVDLPSREYGIAAGGEELAPLFPKKSNPVI